MLLIPINRTSDVSLIRQIYQYIREQILNGSLKSGDKLPSTRELSSNLNVSRNVTLSAYDQLMAEGFIVTRKGAGTFIAEGTYLGNDKGYLHADISIQDNEIECNDIINFRSGIPALDFFPRKTWAKLSNIICYESSSSIFGYGVPEGRIELREVISQYLYKTRRVFCQPDQIIITTGAVQALALVSKLLLSPEDEVLIEDPITNDIQKMFKSSGASLLPIPVDNNGIKTDLLPIKKKPKFVFFTPSHQFPLGGTLPAQRQIQLINYARKVDSYLVEDDYDSEFRYEHSPVSSIQGLAPERVLYIGSFSKILSPALRMGYLILPMHLVKECRKIKHYLDLHTPSLDQLTLAQFITKGHLERHILRMKRIYKKRRDYLITQLKKTFAESINISGYSTGLHLIVEFRKLKFTKDMIQYILRKYSVKIYLVEDHTIEKGKHLNKVILGYGHLSEDEIKEGINRLCKALNSIVSCK
ncbi:MocR-like pyridoxine biosynthesis transcription factor PdxR [Priestia filamentosa]|uniref:MocR-like pyridoxine biosynthesis transcription factor PdxR n=1 Tax=Priestia filamentosa TaxID=1402861 RepID=UPI003982CD24